MAECQVLSKQYGALKELGRQARGRWFVGNVMYSCASLHVCIIVQQIFTGFSPFPTPRAETTSSGGGFLLTTCFG